MKKPAEIAPPRLPKRPNAIDLDALGEQMTYTDLLIADYELSDQVAEFVTFETTSFKQMAMQRTILRGLRLADVRLD